MTEEAGHEEKGTKKKRVENELTTKYEKIPCSSNFFVQHFQARTHAWPADVRVYQEYQIVRFVAFTCVIPLV